MRGHVETYVERVKSASLAKDFSSFIDLQVGLSFTYLKQIEGFYNFLLSARVTSSRHWGVPSTTHRLLIQKCNFPGGRFFVTESSSTAPP